MAQTTSSGGMPPLLNKTMTLVLRSPLHGMISKYLALISFTGRKSGRVYTTPVSYAQHDDRVTIFTHANWWKNLLNNPDVMLRIRGRDLQGIARPVAEDKEAIAGALMSHLQTNTFDAKFYDVTYDDAGHPRADEVEKAVETVVMIQVQLC